MTLIDWIACITFATCGLLMFAGSIMIMLSKPKPDPEEATDASHSPLSHDDTREARIRAEWRGR